MDTLDDELLFFWKCLQKHSVRYIMIGGFATRFHGFNRSTSDVDIWLEDSPTNRSNLRAAFHDAGYGDMPQLETIEFVPGWTNFYISGGIELDIVTGMKGLEGISFSDCLNMASVAEIDDICIPFLHINHLIINKQSVNRPKDAIDVIELQKIKQVREGNL